MLRFGCQFFGKCKFDSGILDAYSQVLGECKARQAGAKWQFYVEQNG